MSAINPVSAARNPIKITNAAYLFVDGLLLNVHLALRKKLHVTATQNAHRFEIDWFMFIKKNRAEKINQWIAVFSTPIEK